MEFALDCNTFYICLSIVHQLSQLVMGTHFNIIHIAFHHPKKNINRCLEGLIRLLYD